MVSPAGRSAGRERRGPASASGCRSSTPASWRFSPPGLLLLARHSGEQLHFLRCAFTGALHLDMQEQSEESFAPAWCARSRWRLMPSCRHAPALPPTTFPNYLPTPASSLHEAIHPLQATRQQPGAMPSRRRQPVRLTAITGAAAISLLLSACAVDSAVRAAAHHRTDRVASPLPHDGDGQALQRWWSQWNDAT